MRTGSTSWRGVLRRCAAAAVAASALATAALALAVPSGLLDQPVYRLDPDLGYVPRPNQRGAFLGTYDYVVNERSMVAGPWDPGAHPSLLLLGDSLVVGGRTMRQSERLGSVLESLLPHGARVWPVGAASWGLRNELSYLERNPDVLGAVDGLVLLTNSGDFGETSCWNSPWLQPLEPLRGLAGLAHRLLPATGQPCPRDAEGGLGERFRRIVAASGKPVFVVVYPKRDELVARGVFLQRMEPLRIGLMAQRDLRINVIDVGLDRSWKPSLYKDEIHPTVEGYAVLAQIIARNLLLAGLPGRDQPSAFATAGRVLSPASVWSAAATTAAGR